MQILKELADGARVHVTSMQHDVDCKAKEYRRLVQTKTVIIYALQRMTTAVLAAQKPLVYGGRGNPRHKDNYRGGISIALTISLAGLMCRVMTP